MSKNIYFPYKPQEKSESEGGGEPHRHIEKEDCQLKAAGQKYASPKLLHCYTAMICTTDKVQKHLKTVFFLFTISHL